MDKDFIKSFRIKVFERVAHLKLIELYQDYLITILDFNYENILKDFKCQIIYR